MLISMGKQMAPALLLLQTPLERLPRDLCSRLEHDPNATSCYLQLASAVPGALLAGMTESIFRLLLPAPPSHLHTEPSRTPGTQ